MEEGEKKPVGGTEDSGANRKIVYTVIAVAVAIIAVMLIAKFGYNIDLLNPAGGQMSLVRPVSTVRPTVIPTTLAMRAANPPGLAHEIPLMCSNSTPPQSDLVMVGSGMPGNDKLDALKNGSDLGLAGADDETCAAIMCNGQCVDTCSDTSNCRTCGNVCTNGMHCAKGTCTL